MDFHQKIFIDCGIKSTSKERWEEIYFFLSDISMNKLISRMASELYLPEQQIFIGIELRSGGDFYLPFFILKNEHNADFRLS
jgi:hypothetical protein